jgi:hypothetical protein
MSRRFILNILFFMVKSIDTFDVMRYDVSMNSEVDSFNVLVPPRRDPRDDQDYPIEREEHHLVTPIRGLVDCYGFSLREQPMSPSSQNPSPVRVFAGDTELKNVGLNQPVTEGEYQIVFSSDVTYRVGEVYVHESRANQPIRVTYLGLGDVNSGLNVNGRFGKVRVVFDSTGARVFTDTGSLEIPLNIEGDLASSACTLTGLNNLNVLLQFDVNKKILDFIDDYMSEVNKRKITWQVSNWTFRQQDRATWVAYDSGISQAFVMNSASIGDSANTLDFWTPRTMGLSATTAYRVHPMVAINGALMQNPRTDNTSSYFVNMPNYRFFPTISTYTTVQQFIYGLPINTVLINDEHRGLFEYKHPIGMLASQNPTLYQALVYAHQSTDSLEIEGYADTANLYELYIKTIYEIFWQ